MASAAAAAGSLYCSSRLALVAELGGAIAATRLDTSSLARATSETVAATTSGAPKRTLVLDAGCSGEAGHTERRSSAATSTGSASTRALAASSAVLDGTQRCSASFTRSTWMSNPCTSSLSSVDRGSIRSQLSTSASVASVQSAALSSSRSSASSSSLPASVPATGLAGIGLGATTLSPCSVTLSRGAARKPATASRSEPALNDSASSSRRKNSSHWLATWASGRACTSGPAAKAAAPRATIASTQSTTGCTATATATASGPAVS